MPEQLLLDHPEATQPSQIVEFGGQSYEGHFPPEINLFGADPERGRPVLIPSALDSLTPGTYGLVAKREGGDDEFVSYSPPRVVELRESGSGLVTGVEAFKDRYWYLGPGMSEVMAGLGYIIENEQIVGVPSPSTLKAAAKRLGVDVALLDGVGDIKAPLYLGAFAEGKYPVATGNESDYKHDIEDDHLTVMVLGAEPLREALQDVARNALTAGGEFARAVTKGIDTFTATLRAVISTHRDLLGEAYGKEEGRRTYLETAKDIGIDEATAEGILRTAQENARELRIPVQELN